MKSVPKTIVEQVTHLVTGAGRVDPRRTPVFVLVDAWLLRAALLEQIQHKFSCVRAVRIEDSAAEMTAGSTKKVFCFSLQWLLRPLDAAKRDQ